MPSRYLLVFLGEIRLNHKGGLRRAPLLDPDRFLLETIVIVTVLIQTIREATVHFSLDVARPLPGRLVYVLFTKQTKTSSAVEISSSIWEIKEDKEAQGASALAMF